ncbi:hypothetical protein BST61_g2355 [Cercospora zeina]
MSDADLDAIRQARLQQLQQSQGGGSRGPSSAGGNSEEDSQKRAAAEQKQSILSQILEPFAADRLNRIRMVNAQRAEDVENRLIMLARSGQLRQRVTEEQLRDILGAVARQQEEQGGGSGGVGKVVVQRRKGGWDDDDLDDLLNED